MFDIREQPGQSLLDAVVAGVSRRDALLILDNCEHVIEACADLAARLCAKGSPLTVLVTSREPLGVSGEMVYHVPVLTLPDADPRDALASARQSDAVRLFVERAALVKPGFTLTRDNAASLGRICRQLDGIPLALS